MRPNKEKRVYEYLVDAIGWTPLVRLNKLTQGLKSEIWVKLESLNPGGSVKDRIGYFMIEHAEKTGKLKPGGVIVEATSGNTGVGLLIAAKKRGYKCIFVMPDKMSQEKRDILKAYGAEVVICPTDVPPDDERSYYKVAERIARETPNSVFVNQYENPYNPIAHYLTTGYEIWEQTEGEIDVFVCGMGTGGTISGVGKFLKERKPEVKVIGIDAVGSVYTDYFKRGVLITPRVYKVEGIGEDFLPKTMDFSVVDDVVQVSDEESFIMARKLAKEEGIFCGGSSGSVVYGAIKYVKENSLQDKLVVALLPDSGYRYLSKFYSDEWMRQNKFRLEDEI